MTTAFALPTDQDELAELAAVGIVFDGTDSLTADNADAASYDAAASMLLRRLAAQAAETGRLVAAMKKEQQLIADHYRRLITTADARETASRRQLKLLTASARAAGFLTSRQTRETTFGEYGWRRSPETVRVLDDQALLAWARTAQPALVKRTEKVTETVPLAAVKSVALALVKSGDECPPGTEYVAESITFIAKPREVSA